MADENEKLVGHDPEPTNQPTLAPEVPLAHGEVPLWLSRVTGLYYLTGDHGFGRREMVRVGRGKVVGHGGASIFLLHAEYNPVRLRRELEATTKALANLQVEHDILQQTPTSWTKLDNAQQERDEAIGERDRARETAVRLDQELVLAKHNLAHVRMTLTSVLGFMEESMVGTSRFHETLRTQLVKTPCPICDPVNAEDVVHPPEEN